MKLTAIISLLFLTLFDIGYKPNPVPKKMHDFIVIAHRGDHTQYPENTLEGYAMAAKNEADYVEIDLRTTVDNQLVSMHDGSVNRMTNGKGLIKDLTLQQIKALKVNARSSTDTATYRVPTFEQILKLCRDKIHIYIDFKEADASATLAILKQYHMEKQVLVYINKPSQYTDWRKTAPGMPLMVILPDSVKSAASLQLFLNKYQPDVLDGDYSEYDAGMVALAKAGGLQVWPDAQGPKESPAVWDKAISIGLTGLQTDNPAALNNYLKQKGLR